MKEEYNADKAVTNTQFEILNAQSKNTVKKDQCNLDQMVTKFQVANLLTVKAHIHRPTQELNEIDSATQSLADQFACDPVSIIIYKGGPAT